MTQFLRDVLRQPDELQRIIECLFGSGRPILDDAAAVVRRARCVYITGIGAGWGWVMCATCNGTVSMRVRRW